MSKDFFNDDNIDDFDQNAEFSQEVPKFGFMEKIEIENPNDYPPECDLIRVPIITTSNTCPFPQLPVAIPLTDNSQESIISEAISLGHPVVFLYRESQDKNPANTKGCSRVGVLGRVMKFVAGMSPDDNGQILCLCGPRVKVDKFNVGKGKRSATLRYFPLTEDLSPLEEKVYGDTICQLHDAIISNDTPEQFQTSSLLREQPFDLFVYGISYPLPVNAKIKNDILSEKSQKRMSEHLISVLDTLKEMSTIRMDIHKKTHKELENLQKENYLQQQLGVIQNELGRGADNDINTLKQKAEEKKWNQEAAAHFDRELQKLMRYNPSSPDYSIQYSYLDTFLSLPWNEYSDANYSFEDIENTLNRDHYGLEKVKERILEQMAVATLRNDNKAPILCLVGPPGVGKTSLGKSIADAMGREYARVSFGGLHDEAEIRGHRRTYIGAMPGRIISSLLKKKTSNPVLVLDEIDKIGKDFKGDPSTALLEVLDPEQNTHFHDNYIDADYDLSNVMFIATANSLETISAPLRDRMEIIAIPGYITAEKVEIGRRHLLPKQLRENGFEENEITFDDEALKYITDYYTRESGVRNLEKKIAKVLRKIAVKKVRGQQYPTTVNRDTVSALLGKEEFSPEMYENNDYVGVVTGLAWTQVGGEILFIESSLTPGKGKLTLTGNLGDVMKESATIALQYLRAHSDLIGLTSEEIDKKDVHIHVPEGAIPKDGPSAGITMVTSLASALTGRKVKSNLAMTGEITLRGKVLPVGGIKEKIIAAKRAGIEEIILSEENRKDINEIQERYIDGLNFTFVKDITEVLNHALL